MAGILDTIFGEGTIKDEYGQTQADRRQPIWDSLIKSGLLMVAGGRPMAENERAQYWAQAAGAIGDIPGAMTNQRSRAAQQMLAQQRMKSEQEKLQLDRRKVEIEEMKANRPKTDSSGNIVYGNGDTFSPIHGWIIKDGQPQGMFAGAGTGGGAAQPPADPSRPPAGKTIDDEIQDWSTYEQKIGMPHDLRRSMFANRNHDVLARLSAPLARQVQAIGDYKEALTANPRQARDPLFMDALREYNPDYQQGEYAFRNKQRNEYSAAGPTGKSMIAMGTAHNHIGTMWDDVKILQNTASPEFNRLRQTIQAKTGQDIATGFNIAKVAVASETAKAFRGSGVLNESEQKEWQHIFDSAQSPEQLQAAIVGAQKLLKGKEDQLKFKFHQDMREPMRDFISPEARAKAAEILAHPLRNPGTTAPASAGAGAAMPTIRFPDDKALYDKLASGTKFKDQTGKEFTKP